jgi:hypothetical protein
MINFNFFGNINNVSFVIFNGHVTSFIFFRGRLHVNDNNITNSYMDIFP